MQGSSLMPNLNGGTSRAPRTVVNLAWPGPFAKNRLISTIFSKYLNCTASLSACMPPWSIGNTLIVKRHTVSMLAVMWSIGNTLIVKCHTVSMLAVMCHQNMASLVLVCMGGVPRHAFYYLFYVVECASCTKVLNKFIKVFLHAY